MNREERRRGAKARRAALAILIAGTLATGGGAIAGDTPVAYADDTGAALLIQGGGGGGGAASSGGSSGGGGGGYIAYYETSGGDVTAYTFGGGGDGGASYAGGGSLSGGGGSSYAGDQYVGGGPGGASYTSPPSGNAPGNRNGRGNGENITDAAVISGVAAASQPGFIPALTTTYVKAGGIGNYQASGGTGGNAEVVASAPVSFDVLTLVSGYYGQSSGNPGGAGGSVSFTGTTLNAKTINLEQNYWGGDESSGAVDFTVNTLVSGKGYAINTSGAPTININNGYVFDITGAADGDVLLDATAVTASGNLGLLTSKAVALTGTPGTLAVGDKLALIKGATGSFQALNDVYAGGYWFRVEYDDATHYLYATVTPYVPVTKVTVTNSASTYTYKAADSVHTMQHAVSILPANATVKKVTWKSSNNQLATVNATGLVTFTGKEGTVRITATSPDGPSHYKDIKVVKNVTKLRTPLTARNLTVKKKISVKPVIDDGSKVITAGLTYKSSNPKVATVDANGNVKGIKKGKATITIQSQNGKKATVKINVAKKAVKLKKFTLTGVKKNALTLQKGKTKDLKIKLAQSKASDLKVTFKSSKSSVAKVDAAGRITAVKKGTAIITAKVGSKTIKVKVTVK